MRNITVTVPGKIHLLGEHSVVYGKPALLAAIDKKITVRISKSLKNEGIVLKTGYPELEAFQTVIENAIKKAFGVKKIPPYKIEITSNIPVGSGLGSSAALSAGVSAALLSFLNISYDKTQLFDLSYHGESFFHGNPSGGDLATVIHGGLVYFRKEFEFLKSISPLPFQIHKNIKQFYLLDTGKPKETTKELVVHVVGSFVKKYPKKAQEIFDHQEQLVKDMVIVLQDGDETSLINCIKQGEKNLEKLGVVGEKTQKIIREIERMGGAAKIMGGGGIKDGSGMVLVYCKQPQKLVQYAMLLTKAEFSQEGVNIKPNDK